MTVRACVITVIRGRVSYKKYNHSLREGKYHGFSKAEPFR